MSDEITIAVAKGRIYKEAIPLLARIGIVLKDDPEASRKLMLDTSWANVKILVIRTTDVPTYVARGAAELGIAGKDVLLEYADDNLYEPIDLGIAQCRMMLAGLKVAAPVVDRPRVVTKYTNITKNYFAGRGQQVEIIKLYGSMELGPVLGLSDWLVDLVDTGNTLAANGLVTLDHIADISSRLIVNKAAMKMKNALIKPIIGQLADIVGDGS